MAFKYAVLYARKHIYIYIYIYTWRHVVYTTTMYQHDDTKATPYSTVSFKTTTNNNIICAY